MRAAALTAVTVLGLLAGAACTVSAAPATAPAGAPAAAPTGVCTGVGACRVVASADVDGDGRADQVGVVTRGLPAPQGGGSITVRVRTATNHTLQTTGRDVVFWPYAPVFGSAEIDGVRGQEIVVGDRSGAHTLQWRVVTYRDGKLVTLAPPPGSGASRASRWVTDGSWASQLGWRRHVSGRGAVTLVRTQVERRASGHGHTGQATTYVWKSGTWQEKSSTTVRYQSDKAAYAVGGWHVAGLPTRPF